jgi:superfamily II DNA/RNA helicase
MTETLRVRGLADSETLIQEAFEALADPLDTLSLSNKMHILFEILRFSEEANDKVLVFTHSIPTLEYVSDQLNKAGKTYSRIDGMTLVKNRQDITKNFNEGTVNVCVVSTRAGGVGLNLFGANRVIILDQHFNPMWEQQAVGRSYRIGQEKAVFVYRLAAAGTFEQAIQNQGLFKEQLATRVVDRKNPTRRAFLGAGDYIFEPKHVEQKDLEPYKGKDPFVLDRLLADPGNKILSITPTETFYTEDGIELTAAEEKEAEQMFKDEQVRRQQQQAHLAAEKKRLEDHRAHLAAEKKKEKDRVKTIQQATKP